MRSDPPPAARLAEYPILIPMTGAVCVGKRQILGAKPPFLLPVCALHPLFELLPEGQHTSLDMEGE